MRILITGGGGLIGQAIAKKHIDAGDEIYIYDTRQNKFNDYSNLVGIDTTYDAHGMMLSIRGALNAVRPELVSHQAALVGVGQSQYDIIRYVDNNIGFTGELLEAISKMAYKPKKILHAGSMGPYGSYSENRSAHEDDFLSPKSIYAVTKQAQEELIRVFSESYEIPAISLRYFSVYGTEQSPLNPYTGVLSVIANMLINSDKVELYDDGTQTRDLINVEDVAEAHFLASRTNLSTSLSTFSALNIGTGTCVSLEYVAERMRDILAPTKPIVFNHKIRSGDIRHMLANNTRAKSYLAWKPKHNIHDDIEIYCQYVKDNWNLFQIGSTVLDEQKNIEMKGLVK